jgi:hypothetical protein
MGELPQLADDQLASFDTEYVDDKLWEPIRRCIDRDYPDGRFTFLDVGGGVGVFADRVLSAYPEATGVVLDNSSLLLDRNQPHPRKTIVLASIEDLATAVEDKFDLVFGNWILHHLVSPSYRRTRRNIRTGLEAMADMLAEGGHLSVYENLYNGVLVNGAPSWLIHRLTSSRAIARISRRGGANTAGVGVCFLSRSQWLRVFERSNLAVEQYALGDPWSVPLKRKVLLHIRDVRCGHFWLEPSAR